MVRAIGDRFLGKIYVLGIGNAREICMRKL